jgi:hypothetical protein
VDTHLVVSKVPLLDRGILDLEERSDVGGVALSVVKGELEVFIGNTVVIGF